MPALARILSGRHWTPRYVYDRVRLYAWEKMNPKAPWLVAEAVAFLAEWLRPTDQVVEFGAGRSTAWLAARVGRVISIETDARWHGRVAETLRASGTGNVELLFVDSAPEPYLAPLARLTEPVDLVLVDGDQRDTCALMALAHLRPGGLLVVDNANWYLPSTSRAPASVSADGAPVSPGWREFAARTRDLRRWWYCDGVSATLIVSTKESASTARSGIAG